MIERNNTLIRQRCLLIDDKLNRPDTVGGRAVRLLANALTERDIEVVEAYSFDDGASVLLADAALHCVFVDWTLGDNSARTHEEGLELLRAIRARNKDVPVFLMADRARNIQLNAETMALANEFVWMLEDTAPFIAGRAAAAIRRYLADLLPPFTRALFAYMDTDEYSWAAPGHQGGVAFTKTAAGRMFFDFYGENLFRTDTGIERTPLGSLLDHEGPVADAETFAARVFGAHLSYNVLNGTSGSNRAILSAVLSDGQLALCDRNCHKSIEQGLVISGAIPVFFTPTRNRYGIIGPILPKSFAPETIRAEIEQHPLRGQAVSDKPAYAVVTNCTYDGMCYHASEAEALLDKSVDRIHFDEAWYAYARFNPIYAERFAMRGDPALHPADGPTVFATHSTHKLLAALSQSSYIHIRNGRRPIEPSCFNEAYMAQSSTSPLYAIIASNEMGAAMMDGPGGEHLTGEAIREAVAFRQALAQTNREYAHKGQWFFDAWNAPEITDRATGKKVAFADADPEQLATDPACWVLEPGASWHGFAGLEKDWCMLDPIKAGIVCPGMGADGQLASSGIPAAVLSAYLYREGIIPSRTTDFMVLCLFSIGVTKGKWGTLVNVLLNFKDAYDANTPLAHILPDLVRDHPARYGEMGLRDLCDDMFAHMRDSRMDKWQAQAFGQLPVPVMPPRAANARLMASEAELLPLDQMPGRVLGVSAIPYPPGIPILMPGENAGPADGPWLSYLRSLESWGTLFPGFEKVVEGAVVKDGRYHFWCLKR
jgi:arginine decarboxylase